MYIEMALAGLNEWFNFRQQLCIFTNVSSRFKTGSNRELTEPEDSVS